MRPRRIARLAGRGLAALGILGAAMAAGLTAYLATSTPKLEGSVEVPGLGAEASIARDAHGVPYIRAATRLDAAFALGFAHAQDRLFQMDMQRRSGAGRLSELFGARTLGFDRFLRALGFERLVASDWNVLRPETRAVLQAYADGVNAMLGSHEGAWPLEYELLFVAPEPWRAIDALLVLKSLNLLLGTNMADELTRARLAGRIGLARVADFWPALPGESVPPLPAPGWATGAIGGSNSWAIAGTRTATGRPILANDPHLGLGLPGLWYLARIETRDPASVEVGATVPGLPFLVLGHNGHLAWSFTNAYIDTQDVFVERLDPADHGRYLTPDGSIRFVERDEVIRVKGEPDRTLRVRETRHGPVISDDHWDAAGLAPAGHALALSWTALLPNDTTADAANAVSEAVTVADFMAAARAFRAPMQNMVVADTEGHIGLTIPGLVPIRPGGVDGGMPAPGWTGMHDWRGFAEIGRLPDALDPPSGVIVTANTRVVPAGFPLLLARDWPPPLRAQRIAALIDAKPLHDVADVIAMQRDVTSLAARSLLPVLGAVAPETVLGKSALALINDWDGTMAADRPEPLIFAAWFIEAWRRIVGGKLGRYASDLAPDPVVLEGILASDRGRWCDDIATETVEDCAGVSSAAFAAATASLAERFGEDPAAWCWGEAHRARHAHPFLGRIPVIGALFSIDQPVGGDRYTINVSSLGWGEDPFASSFGPGFRAVYDLADLDNSRFDIAVGQSGNPFSRHYDDLAGAWLAHEPFALPAEPAGPTRTLKLIPSGP